ncbi:hypothetical protein [Streptomyces sp. BBFR102]|uniref:hypothetical protein n=1 Tax=Streptomyces sp. BBFR102 TaxID=3448171 RepID=UPI003F52A7AE
MKSWRSRIAAAAVVGAAALTIPLTAGSASAYPTDPDGFVVVGGMTTHHECQEQGNIELQGKWNEFQCRWEPRTELWELWLR